MRPARPALGLFAAALCAIAAACHGLAAPEREGDGSGGQRAGADARGAGENARREGVRAFWDALRAANEARLAGSCAGAAALYEQALRADPRHEDALYYAGQCQRELGRPQEARRLFERLTSANPGSARGHLALGALLASPDPREPLDLGAAEGHLRRAHAINAEETGPLVRLGEVLLLAGRRREAAEWLEAALRTNPKSVEAAFLAGLVAWQEGAHGKGPLVRRVHAALRVEAPVKGVLNEGDRKVAGRVAAPPLSNPLGRLLFGAPIAALRERAAAGHAPDERSVTAAWQAATRLQSAHARRLLPARPAPERVRRQLPPPFGAD